MDAHVFTHLTSAKDAPSSVPVTAPHSPFTLGQVSKLRTSIGNDSMMSTLAAGAQHRRHSLSVAELKLSPSDCSLITNTDSLGDTDCVVSPIPVQRVHRLASLGEDHYGARDHYYVSPLTPFTPFDTTGKQLECTQSLEELPCESSHLEQRCHDAALDTIDFTDPFADSLMIPTPCPTPTFGSEDSAKGKFPRVVHRRSSFVAPYRYAGAESSPFAVPSTPAPRSNSQHALDSAPDAPNSPESAPFVFPSVRSVLATPCASPFSGPVPLRPSDQTDSFSPPFFRGDRRQSAPPQLIKERIANILYPYLMGDWGGREDTETSCTQPCESDDSSSDLENECRHVHASLRITCSEISKITGEPCTASKTIHMNDVIDATLLRHLSPVSNSSAVDTPLPEKHPSFSFAADASHDQPSLPLCEEKATADEAVESEEEVSDDDSSSCDEEYWRQRLALFREKANAARIINAAKGMEPRDPQTVGLTGFYQCSDDHSSKEETPPPMRRSSHGDGVSCAVCLRNFSKVHQLRSHIKCHYSPRANTCSECGASFLRMHDLRRHEATHKGTRRIKCVCCDTSFSRKDALLRHMRKNPLCMRADLTSVITSE